MKDLSGHGHDLALKNFAFAGMSGFGGFVFDDSDFHTYSDKPATVSNHIITLNKCNYAESLIYSSTKYIDANTERVVVNRPAFKIKVSGVGENEYVRIAGSLFDGNKWGEQNVIKNIGNGITDIPAINRTYNQAGTEGRKLVYQDFIITLRNTDNSESPSESIITIEILPEYENALVFDGVDDYGAGTRDSFDKCTMLMLFKPIDVDGTISVDFRQTTDDINFAVYRYAANAAYNTRNKNGTYVNNRENTKLTAYSLINKKQLVTIKGDITNITEFVIGANCSKDDLYDKMALYKFLLFDQELTQEQIDKVIQDYHLMDDVDDVWNQ